MFFLNSGLLSKHLSVHAAARHRHGSSCVERLMRHSNHSLLFLLETLKNMPNDFNFIPPHPNPPPGQHNAYFPCVKTGWSVNEATQAVRLHNKCWSLIWNSSALLSLPHLKSPRIPWWGRRGRSDTLFPTGAHKWRLRESHPSRTSLKRKSFGLPP